MRVARAAVPILVSVILMILGVGSLPATATGVICSADVRPGELLVTATLTLEGGVADDPPPYRGVTALAAAWLASALAERTIAPPPRLSCHHHAVHLEFLLLPERVSRFREDLEQLLAAPPLAAPHLEAARRQLTERIRQRRRDPDEQLSELVRRTLWLNLPYRHPPEGYPATLAACDPAAVRARLAVLVPGRCRLHLRGLLPDGLPLTTQVRPELPVWTEPELDASRESCEWRNVEEIHGALAWPAGALAGTPAVGRVAAALAGERLQKILQRDAKALNSLRVEYRPEGGHGMFSVRFAGSETSIALAREKALRELTDLELGQFDDEELERARHAALATLVREWSLDPTGAAAEERSGRLASPGTEAPRIAAVGREDVMHFLSTAFARAHHVYCSIKPHHAGAGKDR